MTLRHALLTAALAGVLAVPSFADAAPRGDRGRDARPHSKQHDVQSKRQAQSRRFDHARKTIRHRTVERASERHVRADHRRGYRDRHHNRRPYVETRRHHRPVVKHHTKRRHVYRGRPQIIIETPVIRSRTTYCPPPVVVERRRVVHRPVRTHYRRDAWTDLENGYHRSALDSFGILASSRQHDALPKIGYALSAAGLHDDKLAATALRRALRADATKVFGFRADVRLENQLGDLERRYKRDVRNNEYDTDAVFLLATIRTLRGESPTGYDLTDGDYQMLSTDDRELLGFAEGATGSMYAR